MSPTSAETTTNEMRTIAVTMTAPAQEFLLCDLLKQRGVIGAIDATLKQAMRQAVQSYLEETEELISGVAIQRKGGNGTKAKGKAMPDGNEVRTMNGNGNGMEQGIPMYAEPGKLEGDSSDVLSLQ